MERYQRVVKPKPEQPTNENEIRITSHGLIRNYVTYAISLFQDKQEKEVVLKAMGQAISKAVTVAEIIKTRVPGLHQNISTSSTTITDVYEPTEEGLNPLEMKRQVSLISVALSSLELNKTSPGYQAPTVKQADSEENQREQQDKQYIVSSTDAGKDNFGGPFQSRGGGRGRGGRRGWHGDYQEDNGYYYYYWGARGEQGRGRGGGGGYRGGGYRRGRGRGYSYGEGRGRGYGRERDNQE